MNTAIEADATIASEAENVSADDKIVCQIDNVQVHSIQTHIKQHHADTWTIERYQEEFPDAPLLSPYAEAFLRKKLKEKKAQVQAQTVSGAKPARLQVSLQAMADIFELGKAPAAFGGNGSPIQISVMSGHDTDGMLYIPETDEDYVFNIDLLKEVCVGFELNMPVYLWGMHGTGKTTLPEQVCARTKRPFMRIQHTINMQESDVLGQWTVKDGATQFQLGPLPMAMLNGWVYCADEYDFAMPSVVAVYQPVLEGKSLLIKDAPPEFRKITPHPEFRFIGTGNTNGVGDETGLYQGTLVQNAANYSRFAITREVKYMEAKIEESILTGKTGITKADAKKLVKVANDVRKMFAEQKISTTISPRELISAARLATIFGRKDATTGTARLGYETGIELAFSNRLSRVDKKVIDEYVSRTFGS